jgi:hypothetical protein
MRSFLRISGEIVACMKCSHTVSAVHIPGYVRIVMLLFNAMCLYTMQTNWCALIMKIVYLWVSVILMLYEALILVSCGHWQAANPMLRRVSPTFCDALCNGTASLLQFTPLLLFFAVASLIIILGSVVLPFVVPLHFTFFFFSPVVSCTHMYFRMCTLRVCCGLSTCMCLS